ncbi:uracil-DNA glycosylase [Sedimenticola selenatireducens]|uniref:uracil-DNA glycosylase n=1 Tax=Sedimenticola selenatireducens TaxID=191960 RepID=UPI00048D8063|nr:uracil-DNA glycosylase family protein [Sedimenticola selenatireducens]
MNAVIDYSEQLLSCAKCKDLLAQKRVDPSVNDETVIPKPIVNGIKQRPIMLVGQAPGIKEYESGKPFQGQAGQDIRRIFSEIGVTDFDEQVWSTAVVKCYPGRKLVKNSRKGGYRVEDEVPPTRMVNNCKPFLEQQIAGVEPKVIVTLGGFPLKAYLRLRGRKPSEGRLDAFVGKTEQWGEKTIVFFPHTSGSSRWLNDYANKQRFEQAKQHLRKALIEAELTAI